MFKTSDMYLLVEFIGVQVKMRHTLKSYAFSLAITASASFGFFRPFRQSDILNFVTW